MIEMLRPTLAQEGFELEVIKLAHLESNSPLHFSIIANPLW
jgi:hypothetical protein